MLSDSQKVIFVTGGTGLIGGELSIRLASRGHNVYLLTRAYSQNHAKQRIANRFHRSDVVVPENVYPVCGDICSPDLGLSIADKAFLKEKCELVVHAAGETAFNKVDSCFSVNAKGARNVRRVLEEWNNLQKTMYISTSSVNCESSCRFIEENSVINGYSNGYTRSKRKAEKEFVNSDLDFIIVRPSIVLAEGLQDRKFAREILWCIPIMFELGEVPFCADCRVDIVPVSYVVECIIGLLNTNTKHRCYHISSGENGYAICGDIYEFIQNHEHQRRIDFASKSTWNKPKHRHRYLMKALNYYIPFIESDLVYSNKRLKSELKDNTPKCPALKEYVLDMLRLIKREEAFSESRLP